MVSMICIVKVNNMLGLSSSIYIIYLEILKFQNV